MSNGYFGYLWVKPRQTRWERFKETLMGILLIGLVLCIPGLLGGLIYCHLFR